MNDITNGSPLIGEARLTLNDAAVQHIISDEYRQGRPIIGEARKLMYVSVDNSGVLPGAETYCGGTSSSCGEIVQFVHTSAEGCIQYSQNYIAVTLAFIVVGTIVARLYDNNRTGYLRCADKQQCEDTKAEGAHAEEKHLQADEAKAAREHLAAARARATSGTRRRADAEAEEEAEVGAVIAGGVGKRGRIYLEANGAEAD
eukprot:8388075-Pyramimonas_sp.AAC.1